MGCLDSSSRPLPAAQAVDATSGSTGGTLCGLRLLLVLECGAVQLGNCVVQPGAVVTTTKCTVYAFIKTVFLMG